MTPSRDRLVDLAVKMSANAEKILDAEGFHAPMCVLWPRDGQQPSVHLLDDSDPQAIAGWGAEIVKAAAETDATTVVFIMEGWTAKPPGRQVEAREGLLVAAANALGDEVMIETPTSSDTRGRRTVTGAHVVRPNSQELSVFGPLTAFWARSFARPPGDIAQR
jgi:hypothetical protein